MEYYSAMKRNEIGSFVEMWMDLQSGWTYFTLIQSEVSYRFLNNPVKIRHGLKMHLKIPLGF